MAAVPLVVLVPDVVVAPLVPVVALVVLAPPLVCTDMLPAAPPLVVITPVVSGPELLRTTFPPVAPSMPAAVLLPPAASIAPTVSAPPALIVTFPPGVAIVPLMPAVDKDAEPFTDTACWAMTVIWPPDVAMEPNAALPVLLVESPATIRTLPPPVVIDEPLLNTTSPAPGEVVPGSPACSVSALAGFFSDDERSTVAAAPPEAPTVSVRLA